mgnify:CR=1 FL=1
MKFLYVTFSDNSTWAIPATVIAHDRACYFARNEEGISTYVSEFKYTMSEAFEIMDWACNNMNYIDIENDAMPVFGGSPDYFNLYRHEWCNADKEIKEVEGVKA